MGGKRMIGSQFLASSFVTLSLGVMFWFTRTKVNDKARRGEREPDGGVEEHSMHYDDLMMTFVVYCTVQYCTKVALHCYPGAGEGAGGGMGGDRGRAVEAKRICLRPLTWYRKNW